MNKLQKQVITTAYIMLNIFLVALPAHATYSYISNIDKLDHISVEANQ